MRMPPPDEWLPQTDLAHVQGFLAAFETLGSYCRHGLRFDFARLREGGARESAIAAYLNGLRHTPARIKVTLKPVARGILRVGERFLDFAFEFADTGFGRRLNRRPPRPSSDAAYQREAAGQDFIDLLVALTHRQPITVSSIAARGNKPEVVEGVPYAYADLVQEQYLLEAAGARHYASLGFNE